MACSTQIPVDGDCRDKSAVRNPLKLAIYNMLSEYTDRRLPWGSLTGIRPTKIAVSYMEAGMTSEDIIGNYQEIYGGRILSVYRHTVLSDKMFVLFIYLISDCGI